MDNEPMTTNENELHEQMPEAEDDESNTSRLSLKVVLAALAIVAMFGLVLSKMLS